MKLLRAAVSLLIIISLFGNGFLLINNASAQGRTDATKNVVTQRCTDLSTAKQKGALEKANERNISLEKDIIIPIEESFVKIDIEQKDSDGNKMRATCGEIFFCIKRNFLNEGQEKVYKTLTTNYPDCVVTGRTGTDLLSNYVSTIYKWAAGLVGVVCVLILLFSGIQISIGGTSPDHVTEAKDRIFRSLLGLVVLFLSAFILYTINPIFFT